MALAQKVEQTLQTAAKLKTSGGNEANTKALLIEPMLSALRSESRRRLDVLFLDPLGSPVIAELKRDRAQDTVELQALKYAAYCSQLTFDDLVEEYARDRGVQVEEARSALLEHAPSLGEREPGKISVRLVAGEFGPAVTSVVLWLRGYGIDIRCVRSKHGA